MSKCFYGFWGSTDFSQFSVLDQRWPRVSLFSDRTVVWWPEEPLWMCWCACAGLRSAFWKVSSNCGITTFHRSFNEDLQSVTQMQVLHTTHNHVVTHIQWHEKVCLCVKHKLIRLIIEAKKLYFNHPLWSSLDQDGLGVCYWTCKDDTKNSRHG